MMRSGWVLASVAAVGLCLSTGMASAKEGKFFAAHIQYLLADIEAQGRTFDDVLGTRFDLEDTLGVDPEDGVPAVELWFHILRRNSILISYSTGSYDGSARLDRFLRFGAEEYPAGTILDSEFDFALARLHYNFRFLDFKVVDLGVLIGVDAFDGDGRVSARGSGVPDEHNDFTAPFPVIGLNVTVKPPKTGLYIYGEATGTSIDISDVNASALDLQARLTWYVLDGPFGLSAGYRYLDLDIEVEDEGEGEYTEEAFYGGIAIRF